MKTLWLIALALGAAACGDDSPLTQIAITVDSEMIPGAALDRITIDVSDGNGEVLQSSHAELAEQALPRKLTLVHEDGPLGPFRVTAAGWLGDDKVVESKRDVWFTAERTWPLTIHLEQRCVAQWEHCGDDQTCAQGSCGPIGTERAPANDAQSTDGNPETDPGGALAPGDGPPPMMPPVNRPPVCSIEEPRKDQRLFKGNDLELKGNCTDESALTDDALRWLSSVDGELGHGLSVKIKANKIELGDHTLILCATDPMGLRGCSDPLTIHVLSKPQPPRGQIDAVRQGDVAAPGPFSSDDSILLEASGTGVGIRFSWWDNFIGDVAGNDKATISSPPIGRHQVTMTVTDEASQTFTHKIEFDVLDAARFQARGHLIDPFEAVNAELSASGESGVTALATDSSGLAFVSNGEQVYAFQSDSQDATPTPLSIDSEDSETIVLNDVSAILVWENGDDSRIYLGSDEGVLSCEYTLGTTPIESDHCRRYENTDGEVTPDGQVTSLAKHSIGDRNWLAIGTDRGLFVSADENGRMGDVVVVTSDEEPIRGVVANGSSFWFATEYNGVYQYDVMGGQIPSLFSTGAPSPPFTTLAVDTTGGIWMGSAGHGVGHFESRTGVWQGWMAGDRFEGLASNSIQCITSAFGLSQGLSREVIWVGTDHGLTRVDPMLPTFTTLAMDAGLPSDDVRAVAIAGLSGHVLVGTTEGLALYNGR